MCSFSYTESQENLLNVIVTLYNELEFYKRNKKRPDQIHPVINFAAIFHPQQACGDSGDKKP